MQLIYNVLSVVITVMVRVGLVVLINLLYIGEQNDRKANDRENTVKET